MRIAVYIPEDHKKSQEAIEKIAQVITKHAGGLTIYPTCSGVWKDDSGNLVHDNISVIETFATKDTTSLLRNLTLELLIIREFLNQNCIAYTIDNNIYFI